MCLNMNWFMNKFLKEDKFVSFKIEFHEINILEMKIERMFLLDLFSMCLSVNVQQHAMVDAVAKMWNNDWGLVFDRSEIITVGALVWRIDSLICCQESTWERASTYTGRLSGFFYNIFNEENIRFLVCWLTFFSIRPCRTVDHVSTLLCPVVWIGLST